MKITFNEMKSGDEVGALEHSGISEILLPAFSEDGHDIFLSSKFEARPGVRRWLVENVSCSGNTLEVGITASSRVAISLLEYAANQSKHPEVYLSKFRIVEVDFGFYSNCFSVSDRSLTKNNWNTSALLPGEMHKRRPCIVVGHGGNRVQVIPMTTSNVAPQNPKKIRMSEASFSGMHRRYLESTSCALLDMVQTVSAGRVFPPQAPDGKHYPKYAQYKLCSTDKAAIVSAMAGQYNSEIQLEKVALEQRLERLEEEKRRLVQANQRIRDENDSFSSEVEAMKGLVLKCGQLFGSKGDFEDICDEIDAL